MRTVGTVKEIWRYPVKGMAGERMEKCQIGPLGISGDRTWALRDVVRQEIQSCKFRPKLLLCTATSRPGNGDPNVDVVFPDGSSLGSDDASISQKLSALVGHESTLESLQPLTNPDFYRRYKADGHDWLGELKDTFTREPGEPLPDFSDFPQEAQDYVSRPGTFFLVTPFHIITTATMAWMKRELPEADWDIRRFRPNIVIETNSDDEGLVEQGWVGKPMSIADSSIECVATAPRCGAVTRAQDGLEFDSAMLRTIVKKAEQNLGIYGEVTKEGTLKVGDRVYVDL